MRLILLSLIAVTSLGVINVVAPAEAEADRYRRSYSRPVYRTNTVVRTRYTGPTRSRVYVNGGHYRFNGGHTVVYRRPYIARRYYDFRVRPTVIVENYPSQNGYIWVSGHWNWTGSEWNWIGGHYDIDPNY